MKIKSVEFAGAIAKPGGEPPGRLPQIAFAGRSNVGKSSLINRLLGRTRRKIARVSQQPGKTQEINFYRVRARVENADMEFFLVDLPGYGFARAPARVREQWGPLIEGYMSQAEELRGVVQILDARRGTTGQDRKLVRYLATLGLPTLFVLTKADKLKRSQRRKQVEQITGELDVDEEQTMLFSAKTGEGRDLLLSSLGHVLRQSAGGSP